MRSRASIEIDNFPLRQRVNATAWSAVPDQVNHLGGVNFQQHQAEANMTRRPAQHGFLKDLAAGRNLANFSAMNPIALTLAVFAMLAEPLPAGYGEAQRISIPQSMPEEGRLPSFKIMVDGVEAGRIYGDAVLSNGRFFGIRWIAAANHGWRAEIREGEPNTLLIWSGGEVRLERERPTR